MLPYTLGYQPTESLLLAALASDGVMGPLLRLDLPLPRAHARAEDSAEQRDLAEQLIDHLRRYATARAVVVVYSDDPSQHAELVRSLAEISGDYGIVVIDAFGVSGTAWRSMLCEDTTCCPTEGHPLSGLRSSAAAAAMVAAGRQVAAGRDKLIADLDTAAPSQRARIAACVAVLAAQPPTDLAPEAMRVWRHAVVRARDRIQQPGTQRLTAVLTEQQATLLVLALRDTLFRDALLADYASGGQSVEQIDGLASGRSDESTTDAVAAILRDGGEPHHPYSRAAESVIRELARLTDPAREPNAWAVLATAHWWSGDGAQATDIVERVLQACPEHTLSGLVLTMCRNGVPPGWAGRS